MKPNRSTQETSVFNLLGISPDLVISLFYLLIGTIWIIAADRIAADSIRSKESLLLFFSLERWFFVTLSAGILFVVLRLHMRKEQSFRELFERSPSGVAVYQPVENGTDFVFVEINPAGLEYSKSIRKDLIGRKVTEVFPGVVENGLLDVFRRVEFTGKTEYIPTSRYKDDRIEQWMENEVYKLPSGLVVAIYTDNTAQHQAEQELEANRRLLADGFNAIPDMVSMKDPNGVYLLCNNELARLVGKPREEIIGKTDYDIFPKEKADFYREQDRIAIANKKPTRNEETSDYLKEGYSIWVETTKTPIYDDTGKLIGVFGIARDISKSKQALKRSEERQAFLDMVVDRSPIPMWISSPNGTLLRANQALYETLNLKPQQVIGRYNLFQDANLNREDIAEKIEALLHRQETAKFELWWHPKDVGPVDFSDARSRYIKVSIFPLLNLEGEMTNLVCQWVDITDHKQTEQDLRASEQRARLMSDLVMDSNQPIAVGSVDNRLMEINPAFCALTGYSRDELKAIDQSIKLTPAEWLPEEEKIQAELDRTGKPIRYEKEYIRKDGTRVPIELFVHLARDSDGNPDYYYAFITDITERKRLIQTLKDRNAYVEAIVENMPIGFALNTVDDGKVKYMNKRFEEIYGWPKEILTTVEMFFEKVYPDPEYREKARTRCLTDMKSGDPERMHWDNVKIVTQSGEERYINAFNIPLLEQNLMISTVMDVTARKQAELKVQEVNARLEQRVEERTAELKIRKEEAEELNRGMINLLEDLKASNMRLEQARQALSVTNQELESFSYSVSHDLRAPLRHVDSFVKLLLVREEGRLDATSRRYLDTIIQASDRMGHLIDDLLTLSRTTRSELTLRRVNMNQIVQKAIKELAPSIGDRRIVWEIDNLPDFQADMGLMRQLWQNLIGNAVKYTGKRDEARIEIGAKQGESSGETIFFVRDNGVGFDPKYADKLFGVFHRLHRDDEFEGLGIGLATVQRIIQRHGGRIWAEGQLNKGAVFYFTLHDPQDIE